MRRLIDANALIERIRKKEGIVCFTQRAGKIYELCLRILEEFLKKEPTVDAVEVPCKVGDLVWGIKRWNRGQKAIQSVVTQMYFGDNMRLGIIVKGVCHGEWGKNVFATEEEALAKIDGERKDDE